MATINISDLHPTGSELFSDSESYMNELNDRENKMINGGGTPGFVVATLVVGAMAVAAYVGYQDSAQ